MVPRYSSCSVYNERHFFKALLHTAESSFCEPASKYIHIRAGGCCLEHQQALCEQCSVQSLAQEHFIYFSPRGQSGFIHSLNNFLRPIEAAAKKAVEISVGLPSLAQLIATSAHLMTNPAKSNGEKKWKKTAIFCDLKVNSRNFTLPFIIISGRGFS